MPGHPLVLIGGAVTFVNPEPLALFADVIAAGEGETRPRAGVRDPGGTTERPAAQLSTPARLLRSLGLRRATATPAARRVPRRGTGAPPVVRKAAVKTTDASIRRTRLFTPDTEFGRASSSKSCAAAPTCAASAGRATTTCRSAPFPRIASSSSRAAPHYSSRAGLVSIALCDHPEIERILTSLAGMGYSISPASLRLDDLTATIVTSCCARAENAR